MRKILGILAFGLFLMAGHVLALADIYGRTITLEQVLRLILYYLDYLFWIGTTGFVGWISYQLITKGFEKGFK